MRSITIDGIRITPALQRRGMSMIQRQGDAAALYSAELTKDTTYGEHAYVAFLIWTYVRHMVAKRAARGDV